VEFRSATGRSCTACWCYHMVETAAQLAARVSDPEQSWSVPTRHVVNCITAAGLDLIAAATRDGSLVVYRIFELDTRHCCQPQRLSTHQLEHAAICMAADDASSSLFLGVGGADIARLELIATTGTISRDVTAQEMPLMTHGRGAVTALAAVTGLLYSAGNDLTIRLWDTRTRVALAVLASNVAPPPTSLCVPADTELLLSTQSAGAGAISLWQLPPLLSGGSGGKSVLREWCIAPVISAVAGLSASRGAAAAKAAARADTVGGGDALDCKHTFPLGANQVHSITAAAGGAAAISASLTGEVQVWDLERLRETKELSFSALGHRESIRAVALIGDALVTAASDRTLRVARCPRKDGHHPSSDARPLSPRGDYTRGGAFDLRAGAHGELSEAGGTAAEVEAMLRGLEDATNELSNSHRRRFL
jgi:WD40 repeat protein